MTITNVMSSLRFLLTDWEGFILNPNYRRRGNEVIWQSSMDIMSPNVLTLRHLKECHSQKNYSFIIHDGSIVQLRYAFQRDETTLGAASLCYFRYTGEDEGIMVAPSEEENDAKRPNGVADYPSSIKLIPVPWIRIDYSPSEAKGITHAACHMHSSLCTEMRIPLTCVPTPRQFMLNIVAWFYPEEFDFRFPDIPGTSEIHIREINEPVFSHIADAYEIMHLASMRH